MGVLTPGAKVLVGVTLAGALWIACDAPNLHIFIAGQYIASLDCVTPGEAVDVLDGPATDASCDATCVVPFGADGAVYVTGACPPFPPGDAIGDASALCPKALAAIHRSDLCLDGGPSNPLVDSGVSTVKPDAGAALDAPVKDGGRG
jgi:hypothetical protein